MDNDFSQLSRRRFAAGLALGSVALALPLPLRALTVDEARGLVDRVVGDINKVINSGRSETAMYGDFERIFSKYADVPVIARSALGVAARSASKAQMAAFTKAYQGYLSRKYGKRFREFIGGKIEVTGAQPIKSYYEVISMAYLQGEQPFEVRWQVSDKSGKNLFFNIIIEGVNMLASERAEVGALLDKRKGDLDAMIADLQTAI
ncbi:MlaC/ttg2D family ABC transporter substrate-binding protein [Fuscibacter oryzae]|uniref:ABC transporter substrate-binding protein n=1 Tax=Fuscibacter oryzae TaxID=2803939 RepID=A0A8J7MWF6_9RHOB|nr:ABC transporter substrate-binding protein [Fuscibacter oryzae]MBL4929144.1 ABC transporter substrate-binding protein [Fuscibacter oryzae]